MSEQPTRPADRAAEAVRGWRLRRGVRLAQDAVRGMPTLLHPEGVVLLNETAAAVLALCDGRRDAAGIAAELRSTYRGVVAEEVDALLADLARLGLVGAGPDQADHGGGG
ncbi:pyrroloquinoline quinone biosynthesis peptide chaperone PqqD [Kitasatospora azatica]|uniref:pyrroloquinoline quinone biosynthesis peptide chaperone PqqD n=1 Tax=Kitasatospora azatica TaxID=58347 RepID=UPI00068F50DD|nr:pyrroloquinoline quinone biosynthesis peptide chaperone PqqD [Kitasatospora azatica]